MQNKSPLFKLFFGAMIFTASIPFIGYLFPAIPKQFFGFNQTGWAWIIMLAITLITLLNTRKPRFPYIYWIPWILYLIVYLILDFSFLGLQLTLQYLLPLLVGIAASGFVYDRISLHYLYSLYGKFTLFVVGMTLFGYLFRSWLPAAAGLPMILSISAAIYLAIYHQFKSKKYFYYFFALLIVPLIALTRMGILVFLVIFVFHFAENRLSRKMLYGTLGLIIGLLIFFSSRFQDKSFYEGKGELSDISLDIYKNMDDNFNNSGRSSFYFALKKGLEDNPLLGNGPRSDNEKLKSILKQGSGEAHNDYLSIRYNYGWIGLLLLFFGFVMQFIHVYKRYLKEPMWNLDILMSSVLVLHLAFWMFMYSDNILKYTIFFPNFFFAMVGISYAQYGKKK